MTCGICHTVPRATPVSATASTLTLCPQTSSVLRPPSDHIPPKKFLDSQTYSMIVHLRRLENGTVVSKVPSSRNARWRKFISKVHDVSRRSSVYMCKYGMVHLHRKIVFETQSIRIQALNFGSNARMSSRVREKATRSASLRFGNLDDMLRLHGASVVVCILTFSYPRHA